MHRKRMHDQRNQNKEYSAKLSQDTSNFTEACVQYVSVPLPLVPGSPQKDGFILAQFTLKKLSPFCTFLMKIQRP